uniref:Type II toxin-antitoxin system VapC family toxin n=1 Tax=Geobacter metallireducens TaxID=28232 RepID=A0A831U9S1_GEOME
MKKYIIDTNALISFVTDRNLAQQERIAGVLEEAARLRCTIICPQHVLTEFVFVMDRVYGVAKAEIGAMVGDFIAMPGIEVRHEVDFAGLLALWPASIPDFGDAIVAAVCKSTKGAAVITFDARFMGALKKAGIAVQGI